MSDETTIGLREAKAKLSEIVGRVRQGNTVLLTLRGRGVARIVPVRMGDRPLAERLADLEQAGLIEVVPAGSEDRVLAAPLALLPPGLAQRYLDEDRGGR